MRSYTVKQTAAARKAAFENLQSRRANSTHMGDIGDRVTVITQLLSYSQWPLDKRAGEPTTHIIEFITNNDEVLRVKEAYPLEFGNQPRINGDYYTLDLVIKGHSPAEIERKDPNDGRMYMHPLKVTTQIWLLAMRHAPFYNVPHATPY
ncbi:hypothetical protein D3C87_687420 [compost metagenome]